MIALWLLGQLLAAPQGFIDSPASQPVEQEATDEDDDAPLQAINEKPWYQSLGLSGFLDAGFGVTWPGHGNTFFVGEVEVDLHKKILDVAALRMDLNLVNRMPWQPAGVGAAPSFATFGLAFDAIVEQAYGEWFPLGENGPRLRLGKYNALVGYERQDPIDRFMVSQSLVFLHGSPANFTGVALDIPLPVSLRLTLHGAFNGWDRGLAPSRNKSFGGQIAFDRALKPMLRLTLTATVLYGTERLANERDYRLGTFFSVALEHAKAFWFASEATYGQEPGLAPGSLSELGGLGSLGGLGGLSPSSGGMSRWWGVSVWLKWRLPRVDWLSMAARYDYFTDPGRTRGLVQSPTGAIEVMTHRQQITANLTAVLTEGVSARLEYGADFVEGRTPDFIRRLSVAQRLVLQAVLRF